MDPNATIRYHASNMILMMDTYAAYLFLTASPICITDQYYFTNSMIDYSKGTPTLNGPILTECNNLKTTVSSSAEV